MIVFLASILYGAQGFFNFHKEWPKSTLQDYTIYSTQNPFDPPMQITMNIINTMQVSEVTIECSDLAMVYEG